MLDITDKKIVGPAGGETTAFGHGDGKMRQNIGNELNVGTTQLK